MMQIMNMTFDATLSRRPHTASGADPIRLTCQILITSVSLGATLCILYFCPRIYLLFPEYR